MAGSLDTKTKGKDDEVAVRPLIAEKANSGAANSIVSWTGEPQVS